MGHSIERNSSGSLCMSRQADLKRDERAASLSRAGTRNQTSGTRPPWIQHAFVTRTMKRIFRGPFFETPGNDMLLANEESRQMEFMTTLTHSVPTSLLAEEPCPAPRGWSWRIHRQSIETSILARMTSTLRRRRLRQQRLSPTATLAWCRTTRPNRAAKNTGPERH